MKTSNSFTFFPTSMIIVEYNCTHSFQTMCRIRCFETDYVYYEGPAQTRVPL